MIWLLAASLTALGAAAKLLEWIQGGPIDSRSEFAEINAVIALVVEWGMVIPIWAITIVIALRVARGR